MNSAISMGMVFVPIVLGAIAIGIGFIVSGLVCSWAVALVLLISGGVIKLVNIKVKWRSFSVYGTVLMILGGVVSILSVVSMVYGIGILVNGSNGADLSLWLFYLLFSVGMAVFVPLGDIGILLELIYRKKQKTALKIFSVSLITIAAIALAVTVGIMIWLAPGIVNL